MPEGLLFLPGNWQPVTCNLLYCLCVMANELASFSLTCTANLKTNMGKGLIITLVIIGVILVFGFGFFMWGTGIYDSAVQSQEKVNAEFADVQAAYQRRADLIPNLVATVQGAAENERRILTEVTQARAGIVG